MNSTAKDPLLRVVDLKTYFYVGRGTVQAVRGVSFYVNRGEVLGIVGESGCGKSITGLSILRLIPNPPGRIVNGNIIFEGEDLLQKDEKEMRRIRGRKITMIQQNPDSSLNPVFKIGKQVAEAITIHKRIDRKPVWDQVVELLRMVRIASPDRRALDYPHQMSGGMRQRVAGAIALACQAKLLIADEPTTSLDVTIQMEYMNLLKELQKSTGISIIFITHDFGIVSQICHRIAVMYAGQIVETGPSKEIMQKPKHPYTIALLNSVPMPGSRGKQLYSIAGQPPDPLDLPKNCSFASRCSRADDRCKQEAPNEVNLDDYRSVSCFHVE